MQKSAPLNGRQADGFEELVCQLAALEKRPNNAEYFRKGKGRDAGLECFVRFADGAEHGWQVKYSWSFDANLKRSLNKSLEAAIKKHPNLEVITVCLPFDLSDARGAKQTPLAEFIEWRDSWVAEVGKEGRHLDIRYWGQAQLLERLTSDDPNRSGRILYWFDTTILALDWFKEQFERTLFSLGARYTQETNVDVPARRSLLGLSRNPELLRELAAKRKSVRDAANDMLRSCNLDEAQKSAFQQIAVAFDAVEDLAGAEWPTEKWLQEAKVALEICEQFFHSYLRQKWQSEEDSSCEQPSENMGSASRRAAEIFSSLVEFLSDKVWNLASASSVLVTGEAGAGKSHLIADACAAQIEKSRPALIFLGGTLQDKEIWPQILEQLGLPHSYTRDTFLGALDAAGEAAGVRALLCIDAINERHGRDIWPDRLAMFLHDVSRFRNIALVLSCRSTYLPILVPPQIDETQLPRLEHRGFSNRDARNYLKLRGIFLPDHPFLEDELRNPLFLKTCCDALDHKNEKRFPKGLRGVTAVFDMFRSAVCDMLERKLRLNPRRQIPDRAIKALASEIRDTKDPYIAFGRAEEIVDAIYANQGNLAGDLLFHLESEGVLAIEPLLAEGQRQDYVRFTFERFGEHVAASAILDDTLDNATLDTLDAETPLVQACVSKETPWGVLDALAVQLPERTGAELPDLIGQFSSRWIVLRSVSPATVSVRAPQSVTERTLELLEKHHGESAPIDIRVRLSLDASSHFDAHELHRNLIAKPMAERDAQWSIYVALNTDDNIEHSNSPLNDLIDWALETRRDELDPKTAELAAITLTWCLTTSSRSARDRATKALIALLDAQPLVGVKLFNIFDKVDDPYVGERLAAAIYGAALQSAWDDFQLSELAQEVVGLFFVHGRLPLDILWRDHLSSLLSLANARGCKLDISESISTEPPFESTWPLEYVPDQKIADYTRTYRNGYVSTDEIVSSTGEHGDFARYIIKNVIGGWAAAPRGTESLPTDEDMYWIWKAEFDTYATPEMRDLHDQINDLRAKDNAWAYAGGETAERYKKLEAQFEEVLGTDRFERYRTMANQWRPGSKRWSTKYPAEFNFPWARRWVCMRAHELGWSENLHGQFDSYCGHGRQSHRQERIGKKYQWIALRELMARISDNCSAANGEWIEQYAETIRSLRDIDPSHLIDGSSDWGWASFEDTTFWMPAVLKPAAMPIQQASDWLRSDADFLNTRTLIELAPDSENRLWLPLCSFQHFRRSGTTQETSNVSRTTWMRLNCLVVHEDNVDDAIDHLKGKILLDSYALGLSDDRASEVFLGEHGWRNSSHLGWTQYWGGAWNSPAPVEARGTTVKFLQESGHYDLSLRQNISVELPAPWLMNILNLKLVDGRDVIYANNENKIIYFDPSIRFEGPSTALIARETFISMCVKERIRPIWVVGGAKEVYVESGEEFGRRSFTTIWTMEAEKIVCMARAFEKEGRLA
ncbi:ATP-binding protein [uncultured Roseibium sp.]|uniref:ATP-binding protein n=1 Tax=uncultured Roseibium sp. TaxID=1936171 RepID=UPI00321788F8